MAAIKHARTIALQATSPRIVAVPLPTNITADWTTNVTGTGKPANDATQNRIQTGASFSGTPVNGDIWIDTSVTPNIVRTRIGGAWVASANNITNTNQMTDGAGLGTTADWGSVTGTGKPADDATQNRIQTGTSFSGTPVNGDIWIDTNTSPAIVKTRVSGAWVSSANYTTNTTQLTDGAGLGTTATWAGVTGTGKPSSYADVTTTIMGNSGTSILMTASNLFKSASGLGGVFIGSGGLFGKNTSGVTTFSIDGATGAAVFAGSLSAATGTFAGSLSAATGSFAGSLSAATGSFGAVTAGGAVTVNTSGSISNGISYGGTGFFLGYSGADYKFSVGDSTKYMRWDGSALSFSGDLSTAGKVYASGSNTTSGGTGAISAYSTTANSYAVVGTSTTFNGTGGFASASGMSGVFGQNTTSGGIGVSGTASGASSYAGYFNNTSGYGVYSTGWIESTKTIRSTGGLAPSSGTGVEILYTGGNGYVQAYDRGGSAYLPLYLSGSIVVQNGPSASSTLLNASGFAIDKGFGCNGKSAQAAYSVNAASTDLATVVALCNQLRAALIACGITV